MTERPNLWAVFACEMSVRFCRAPSPLRVSDIHTRRTMTAGVLMAHACLARSSLASQPPQAGLSGTNLAQLCLEANSMT